MSEPVKKLRDRLKECGFLQQVDPDVVYFAKQIRKDLRDERDHVIAITGYPGLGKSQLTAVMSILVDYDYEFDKNILFIPTSSAIKEKYYNLPMYSVLHVDEASRGLHKQQWHDKVQQTLNQLYDTEREGHFLCTFLIMPRFQNFTENFRNFRIKYWINIVDRGLAIAYIRDEDKDSKDPWHLDENYKIKFKKWRAKRIFERNVDEVVKMEQKTKNYFFYFQVPEIPKEIWAEYQKLKAESRVEMRENEANLEMESYKDKVQREKMEKWKSIATLKKKGKTNAEIGVELGLGAETIRRHLRAMEAYERIKGNDLTPTSKSNIIIYKHNSSDDNLSIPEEFDKI